MRRARFSRYDGKEERARLAGRRSLIIVAFMLGVLACSGQSVPSLALAKLGTPFGSPDLATTQPSAADMATAIRACLVDGGDPAFGVRSPAEQTELTALYQIRGDAALWIDTTGRPSRQARESLMLLRDAQSEGLDPADYRPDMLDTLAATLGTASSPIPRNVASFDVALSRAMLRYFRHLHLGRIDPRTIGFRWNVSAEGHDFAALLRSAVADDHIAETVAALRPSLVQYNVLRTMLTRYRSLAADVSLGSPPAPAAAVHPGEPYAELDVLYRQLVMFGDLPTGIQSAAVPETYEGDLVEGVKRFQIRHGLEPDGILGKGTQAALRVPLAWRVRQIELALERLRWLPDLGDRRLVAINIPMFRLWAWDSVPNDAPTLAMDVIVGRALSTQTPVFDEEMREVIFRPYWNVPAIDPSQRDSPTPRARSGLSASAEHGDRAGAWRQCPTGRDYGRQPRTAPAGNAPCTATPRAAQRARSGQVRLSERGKRVHARDAGASPIQSEPSRLQPRLRARGESSRACGVGAQRESGVDPRSHRVCDGGHAVRACEPPAADSSDLVLHHRSGHAGGRDDPFCRRHLPPRRKTRPGACPPESFPMNAR